MLCSCSRVHTGMRGTRALLVTSKVAPSRHFFQNDSLSKSTSSTSFIQRAAICSHAACTKGSRSSRDGRCWVSSNHGFLSSPLNRSVSWAAHSVGGASSSRPVHGASFFQISTIVFQYSSLVKKSLACRCQADVVSRAASIKWHRSALSKGCKAA